MTTCSEQKIKEQPNKALRRPAIPLRSIAAGELSRYQQRREAYK